MNSRLNKLNLCSHVDNLVLQIHSINRFWKTLIFLESGNVSVKASWCVRGGRGGGMDKFPSLHFLLSDVQ